MSKPTEKNDISWLEVAFRSISHPLNEKVYQAQPGVWAAALHNISSMYLNTLTHSIPLQNINFTLQSIFGNAIVPDPYILKDKTVSFTIMGKKTELKIDTGARVTTWDAQDIEWDRGKDAKRADAALLYSAKKNPEDSVLFIDDIPHLPKKYQSIAFGTLHGFKRMLNSTGTKHVDIKGPWAVVGISWPKRSNGERDEMPRPIIEAPIKNHPLIKSLRMALVARKGMSKRGLFGLSDIKQYGLSIVADERDTSVIDFSKIDPHVLNQQFARNPALRLVA